MGAIAAGIVLILVVVGWIALQLRPATGPQTMPDSTYNVAIAAVPATAAHLAADVERLGQWLLIALQQEREAAQTQGVLSGDVTIWHDSLEPGVKGVDIGPVFGATPAERTQAAAELAKRLHADVVLYTTWLPGSPSSLAIEFYVAGRVGSESNLTLGRYALGDPVPIPPDLSQADSVVRDILQERLTGRVRGLFWVLLGLHEDLQGDLEESLQIYQMAEERVRDWDEQGEGKEVLYFFIGRVHTFLNHYDQAIAYLDKALALNPSFARAQIARASAELRQAMLEPPDVRLDSLYLVQAIQGYTRAVELAQQVGDPVLMAIAQIARANAIRLQAESLYSVERPEEALAAYDQAIALVQEAQDVLEGTDQHRLRAQAHAYLGAAQIQKAQILETHGHLNESLALYRAARDAFAACVTQLNGLIQFGMKDTVLAEQIVPECKRNQALAQEILAERERSLPP